MPVLRKKRRVRQFMSRGEICHALVKLKINQIIRVALTSDEIGAKAAAALADALSDGLFKHVNNDPLRTTELRNVARKGVWQWEFGVVELWVMVQFHHSGAAALADLLGDGVSSIYVAENSPIK